MTPSELHIRYRESVKNAWVELPLLVDAFIARLANALPVSTCTIEDAVAELLELSKYEELEVLCQVLGRVHPYLSDDNPEDSLGTVTEPTAAQQDLRGLSWAALQAWAANGLSGVGCLAWRRPAPLERVPYEELSAEGDAWGVLRQFLDQASHLREQVLEGYVLASSPAATEDAVEYALDLADVLARSVDQPVPELAAVVLRTRGLDPLPQEELEELWDDSSGYSVQDWSLLERAEDPHVDAHADRLEAFEGGHVATWQLRLASVALSPMALSGYYDDSPTLFGVLTQAPPEARFRVNALADGPQDYLVPAIHFYGFVRSFSDIPAMLRCAPRMPETVDVVSAEEALGMGCPALAGWYRLDWSTCL